MPALAMPTDLLPVIQNIPIEKIALSKTNHRSKDPKADQELMNDIDQNNLINPITVRLLIQDPGKEDTKEYELIAGERRLRACINLLWKNIPANVITFCDDQKAAFIQASENIHRKELKQQQL